jgi:hypothetical protein
LITEVIAKVEDILGRKLTGEELLVLGIAYHMGLSDGKKKH